MPNVRVLDEQTANQIAAGEVVERPAAAVKELMENSLDAGATRIAVEAEEGGRRLIRLTDNGCGMTPEDAELALQRHATSKIRSADDLNHLRTLGFRGEALPSIASVCQFEIVTRTPESETGFRLMLEGGRIVERGETGAPVGTRIAARNLFYNTPARLKFIKSVATEMNHIAEIAGRLAMAHAGVAVRMLHNGREVFSTPGTGDSRDALAALWGRDRAAALLVAESESPAATVTGFVSPPEHSRPNRAQQAFFINGRPVVSRLLSHALDQAFRPLIPDGRFSAAALFLAVPPEDVDVNVHPSKTEVRFRDERPIHSAVSRAIRSALMQTPDITDERKEIAAPSPVSLRPLRTTTPSVPAEKFMPASLLQGLSRPDPDEREPSRTGPDESIAPSRIDSEAADAPTRPAIPAEANPPHGDASATKRVDPHDEGYPSPDPQDSSDSAPEPRVLNRSAAEMLGGMRILGQAMNTFLVGETREGLLLIDQHVAHERILYERLMRARDGRGKMSVQRLLLPLTVTFSSREAAALEARLDELARYGFDIEPFGGESFVVRAIPADLAHRNPEAILRDLAADFNEEWGPQRTAMERAIDAVVASASCHGAIKANMPLGLAEMERLVKELMKAEDPYHCPHGRPVIVKISTTELLKWFKRTG